MLSTHPKYLDTVGPTLRTKIICGFFPIINEYFSTELVIVKSPNKQNVTHKQSY